MNGVTVGQGRTERPYALAPGSETTLRATTTIRNGRLDEWWVSHLRNDQVTDLTVDFYLIVDPDPGGVVPGDVEPFRIDTEAFDYHTTVETDIFGTKGGTNATAGERSTATPPGTPATDLNGGSTAEPTPAGTPTVASAPTATPTSPPPGGTPDDGGILG